MKRQSLLRGALALALAASAIGGTARAADYPAVPIRIVVPCAAGGIADVPAHLVGARLAANRRQPLVVENRPGANGTIALQFVARARPDGDTLLLGNTGTQVVNRFLCRNLPFDLEKDFQPIGLIASTPMLLVVAPSHPAHGVAERVAMARAAPGRMNFGSAGNGSASHLAPGGEPCGGERELTPVDDGKDRRPGTFRGYEGIVFDVAARPWPGTEEYDRA
ncbi:Bug family tripartite tricarboxylate transporter substrate binding protein [Caldovatus aquaticus]|uniref:Tripartite tricarboxylate transporter substrate binding protein n=1 Tax=Caldovatus aquaticus TaxID=2865671 RepID=A0ABS7F2M9_9PROT|nr:tripartite tricarboxylate transporter substrate-binding protein [Caldovatus aquaticus]MBW8269868.1 hypothetical protein [Caldovatus aquaticus]